MKTPKNPATLVQGAAASRDLRLDFFRGVALICIFIDHIPENYLNYFTLSAIGFSDAAWGPRQIFLGKRDAPHHAASGGEGCRAISRPQTELQSTSVVHCKNDGAVLNADPELALGQVRRFDARFEPRPRESKTLVIAPSFCLAVLVSPLVSQKCVRGFVSGTGGFASGAAANAI